MGRFTPYISSFLDAWYVENHRPLPWRPSRDPYVIWLSEVIMQQTRVEQGSPYFIKFLDLFPTVHDLADADADVVMKAWEGLGYYSRARNLHKAAKMVAHEMNGQFPKNAKDLKELPGVGNYIAAAIASICYGEDVPVVDGNVYRLLSRIYLIDTEINSSKAYAEFAEIAARLIQGHDPGLLNQAMMEYGARVCTYKKPSCEDCGLRSFCAAYSSQLVDAFPVKKKKKVSKERYLNYHVILYGQDTFIRKRDAGDVWQDLHEFHCEENSLSEEPLVDMDGCELLGVQDAKHILSHQNIHARFFLIRAEQAPTFSTEMMQIPFSEITNFAFARLTTRYLEENADMINKALKRNSELNN